MKTIISFILAIGVMTGVQAAELTHELKSVPIDINNKVRLQRGARLFMNYCSGCHSLKYMRYNRMAMDLGLTTFDGAVDTALLTNNLIFTKAKIQDPIEISMPEVDARQWFGKLPPDLSLKARERGTDWLYTYLTGFYADHTRPFGANNILVPDVAMPNVLEPLQGRVILDKSNQLILIEPGEMTEQEFASSMEDLVTFLAYVGEPAALQRYTIGVLVLMFLAVFLILTYQLKKIYWRKIH